MSEKLRGAEIFCRALADEGVEIVFGYPSEEMIEQLERGEIVLGGCCVTEDDPEGHCKDCAHSWSQN